jgi:hypothetical protein
MSVEPLMTLREAAEKTGMSQRYWQLKARSGEVPGTRKLVCGKRCIYFIERAGFDAWWNRQLEAVKPCQENITSIREMVGTGSARGTRAKRFASHSKQDLLDKLKSAATAS